MNDDPRYGPEIEARMRSLAGAGRLADGPGVVHAAAGDAEQGARVELDLRVVDGRVAEARFRAFGCPHFIASASWLTESLLGADREGLAVWDWRAAADTLGVPPAKFGRLLTLQDAVRDAARNWPGAGGSTV